MEKILMIKYGELFTKKDNIKVFINKLYNNIKLKIDDSNVKVTKDRVRMYVYPNVDNIDEIILKLQEVFGIHSIVICYKIDSNLKSIEDKALELLKSEKFNTFKVTTNRADKTFKYDSMEVSKMVGAHILKNIPNIKVDVHNPELLVHIEIRSEGSYIYFKEIKGLGGYPSGIQGKGLLMLSGGIDSPVAGYLANKRGVDIDCIYFESPPHTSIEAKNKVISLAKELTKYGSNINLFVIPFTKLQEAIYKNIDNTYMITIMRRMMYRIAEKVAKKTKSKIIINGESIGQVASQTLTSMSVINNVTNMPIIRPVGCMDKLEIIELSKKINTYDISILPYEDCCTIFVPRHPVINPNLSKCIEYEENIEYEKLIDECILNMEKINIKEYCKNTSNLL